MEANQTQSFYVLLVRNGEAAAYWPHLIHDMNDAFDVAELLAMLEVEAMPMEVELKLPSPADLGRWMDDPDRYLETLVADARPGEWSRHEDSPFAEITAKYRKRVPSEN